MDRPALLLLAASGVTVLAATHAWQLLVPAWLLATGGFARLRRDPASRTAATAGLCTLAALVVLGVLGSSLTIGREAGPLVTLELHGLPDALTAAGIAAPLLATAVYLAYDHPIARGGILSWSRDSRCTPSTPAGW